MPLYAVYAGPNPDIAFPCPRTNRPQISLSAVHTEFDIFSRGERSRSWAENSRGFSLDRAAIFRSCKMLITYAAKLNTLVAQWRVTVCSIGKPHKHMASLYL
jgi:hypothetical protein